MKKLSELKSSDDFQILRTWSNGVEHDGPDRCTPKNVIGMAFAFGQVWERHQIWVDKGYGTYTAHYHYVEFGPEGPPPSQDEASQDEGWLWSEEAKELFRDLARRGQSELT